ncbi:MAG: threonylcarbamoyl-AMP synthase [Deltaproteobacteria bacterium]|nr:threonylcarbamoyl-AMP synthase [Deltaproteobacteria bacterium]MBW2051525.1 threonylcarbamoyl-AMP synthase [Deltaproteobacteria bacterium]MBW2139733.1 threonylcarbamoyl-AMP synthase [Deltaproteobacteria bacterium]MBW2322515.1 threonylcarbamoyl-AMP synthase [Deltaproteobacteria bacterium]
MPRIIKIDPNQCDYMALGPVVSSLLNGEIVAGPTQTFYGLMASADQPEAIKKVMALKNRPANKPLLLLLDRTLRVGCYARYQPYAFKLLAKKFWPGPLTILLEAHPGQHPALIGPRETIGLRVEGLPIIRVLVRALDRAVTGTSANPAGEPPALTPEEVINYFGNDVDLILDGGPCPGGKPSTMIDASTTPPRLLRDGPLSLDDLLAVLPDLRT